MSSLPPRFGLAPSAADLDALGRAALAAIPSPFADHLPQIVFQVEDFADDTTLAELGAESPYDITGLYVGTPVGEADSAASGGQPDMIFLYRQPLLLEWCETDETLEDIVTHLIIHEVGHHFGLSDDDMHRIEDQC
jgi:predicted Zn-dependent protease with MMP-like domain